MANSFPGALAPREPSWDIPCPTTQCRERLRVFQAICQQPGISRKKIIASLRARPTTVSHIVAELLKYSLVEERERIRTNSSGRPEVTLYPRKNRFLAISGHIVAHTLKVALVNPFEEVLVSKERLLPAQSTPEDFLRALEELVGAVKSATPEGSTLLGASLHLPGFMDTVREVWIFAARWPNIRNLSFQRIREAVGIPCTIHRMLDAALEYLLVSEPEAQGKDVLLVHWGYGIGAAFAHRGTVFTSNIGGVCEIGHWKVEEPGSPCTCGSRGCLESISALSSLMPLLKNADPGVPTEEGPFLRFLSEHPELWDSPVVKKAIESMGKVLGSLFLSLFPKITYLYGPLTTIPFIQRALRAASLEHVPPFAQGYLELRFLPPRFHGERFGSCRELFREAYGDILQGTAGRFSKDSGSL